MLQELYYDDGQGWNPLPEWARFYLSLGAALRNRTQRPSHRLVVGLVMPARGYAAAFIATGVVAAAAKLMDLDGHFRSLRQLPPGSPVRVYQDELTWFPGLFEGVVAGTVEPFLVLKTVRTEPSFYRSKSRCLSVRHDPHGRRALPHTTEARHITGAELFISTALPGVDSVQHLAQPAREVVINGQINQLEAELVDTPFAARSGKGHFVPGRLQDIVRAARWIGGADSARSQVVAPDDPGLATMGGYRTAIFDGNRSFQKARHWWPTADWVVLLDRSSPSFMEGVYQLNEDYMRWPGGAMDLGIVPPPGVELMAFEEEL